MENKYINLIKEFKKLDVEDKKEEILLEISKLLQLLYYENKKIDDLNTCLDVLNKYSDDSSYFDVLYTYIISLKEENAKLIEKIDII